MDALRKDSCGITATKMDALRKSSREAGVYVRIVRNTLLKRAVEGTEFACMDDVFAGPTLIAFSMKHPGAAARIFKEFAKKEEKFKVKGCAYEGEFIPADQLDVLASLPTFEEGVAKRPRLRQKQLLPPQRQLRLFNRFLSPEFIVFN